MEPMQSDVKAISKWLASGSINLFGRPFAGKDTQAAILAELFGGVVLGGGDILRASTVPNHIKAAMATGELIPTTDYLNIVLPFLSRPEFAGKPLILSSVGRWHGEEPGVIEATSASGHPMRVVIYLEASEIVVKQRWQAIDESHSRAQRADHDKLETRLAEFANKTVPVIDFYRNQGLLVEVDANKSSEEVTSAILAKLESLASQ